MNNFLLDALLLLIFVSVIAAFFILNERINIHARLIKMICEHNDTTNKSMSELRAAIDRHQNDWDAYFSRGVDDGKN